MKKLLLALLLASSASVQAHGHYPQQVEKYVTDSMFEVEFDLSNHFQTRTCFNIEVNGKIVTPYRTCLQPTRSKKMRVWVSSPPDVQTENVVCSIAENKGSINTRMCTSALTLFPLKYLTKGQ